MLQFSVIGHLGGNAEVKNINGKKFVSFNVAHTDVWTDEAGNRHEETIWVSCALNGEGGAVLPYLVRGQQVYVQGRGSVRCYSSPKERRMVAGCNISVDKIELVGGRQDEVPRELIAEGGALVPVYKAYYIAPDDYANVPHHEELGCEMTDRRSARYQVDKNGFVIPIKEPQTTEADDKV